MKVTYDLSFSVSCLRVRIDLKQESGELEYNKDCARIGLDAANQEFRND